MSSCCRSSAERPASVTRGCWTGQSLYPSVQAKAAQLGFGLVCNHPFVDGNKRIGTHVMLVFLALNGIDLSYTQQELIDMIFAVASSQASAADLLQWIIQHQN